MDSEPNLDLCLFVLEDLTEFRPYNHHVSACHTFAS